MKIRTAFALTIALLTTAHQAPAQQWPQPKAPVVPGADGYVSIPRAAVPPDRARTYKAIWDATMKADTPDGILPSLRMAGSEMNALGVAAVPLKNARFVFMVHGPAVDGILNDVAYKAKFGMANPNLKVIKDLRRAGVLFYVCGQTLAASQIDPRSITSDVVIAADALLTLMTYHADGYAILYF